ncbi:MAG: 3-isopropylmalate dehydratase [Planctomycetes bacterium DG_23]|nr:MAG: 3-isopropylmalate dehydratase [Planctomycetes bacterium DG_23]
MAMTITEKIIAAHSGKDEVRPGEFVFARVDLALGNDITAPMAIHEFETAGFSSIFDKEKIVLVPDHFTPAKDIKSAGSAKVLRNFAGKHQITHYYEVGRMGIEHALLPEEGLVLPGDLVVGADSHTCTYGAVGAFSTGVGSTDLAAVMATGEVWLRVPESMRFVYKGELGQWLGGKDLILYTIGQIGVDGARYRAMEFTGPVISNLSMDGRFTMCNMAIEAGGKSGVIVPDKITEEYVKERAGREYRFYTSDEDACYEETFEFDVSGLSPQVALPPLPSNSTAVEELSHIKIDQVVIGSCTNGRLSDLQEAAEILEGRKVNSAVRLIVIPATQNLYLEALRRGFLEVFVEAGGVVSTPTCGPCLGGHMGVLAEGERCLSTTNRNFTGRMGHPQSEVFLCGPAVAAASSITGRITHPAEVMQKRGRVRLVE